MTRSMKFAVVTGAVVAVLVGSSAREALDRKSVV